MKRISVTRRYDVPVERAFAFITNPENWWKFWPGYVRLGRGSQWKASGDEARLVIRLLGRERELTLTLTTFEQNRIVAYTSTQPGLPDAYHERRFEPDGDGFLYRLVVEYEPRAWLARIFDATLLPLAIRRAFKRTVTALEQEFRSPSPPSCSGGCCSADADTALTREPPRVDRQNHECESSANGGVSKAGATGLDPALYPAIRLRMDG
jgi:hypothetical protein